MASRNGKGTHAGPCLDMRRTATPAILLSVNASEEEGVRGLDSGSPGAGATAPAVELLRWSSEAPGLQTLLLQIGRLESCDIRFVRQNSAHQWHIRSGLPEMFSTTKHPPVFASKHQLPGPSSAQKPPSTTPWLGSVACKSSRRHPELALAYENGSMSRTACDSELKCIPPHVELRLQEDE